MSQQGHWLFRERRAILGEGGLSSSELLMTKLRGKEANPRVSPWSQGEVGADLDRSSSEGEPPEAGCGDSAPARS